jgi:hypothetical protein
VTGRGDVGAEPPQAVTPRRRRPRRAVRPGTGDPGPSVELRSADDTDVGWQVPADGSDDERLRREVPPHW